MKISGQRAGKGRKGVDMAVFKGAGVALVTPFKEDETVDYQALRKLLEWQIAGGTDAVILCGTTGEPATMTMEEKLSVTAFAVETVNHRIPVIAGTGGNCTKDVIAMSKRVQELGVDGLLVVTPYYNKATQNGLYEHYKAIAREVTLPIILYNVPSRTGVNIQPQTAVRLARECENIVGVKEASGDISQVAKLAELGHGILDIYSGNDDQIIPILSLGGIGVISVLSNVLPRETHDMVTEYLSGDRDKALELQLKHLPLANALFWEVNPIPVKAALHTMGLCENVLRLPLTCMEGEKEEKLRAML